MNAILNVNAVVSVKENFHRTFAPGCGMASSMNANIYGLFVLCGGMNTAMKRLNSYKIMQQERTGEKRKWEKK